ncbi:MAG: DUF6046 domain-containing protein [Bacteroidota bacterium]
MAHISISLSDLFEKTFGYKTKAFDPKFKHVTGDAGILSDRKEQGANGAPYYATSSLGIEYYMPVTLSYEETEPLPEQDGTLTIVKKYDLPYPVISMSSKKTFVETALTERSGTVKELINVQDYEITVRGFLIGTTHEFPESEMTQLRSIYEKNIAVSISSALTDIFLLRPRRNSSDKVVLKELVLPSLTGVKNVRPYELRMVSDEAFNLVIQ